MIVQHDPATITKAIVGGFLVGLFMWMTALIHGSFAFKATANATEHLVHIGPLLLTTLTRQPVPEGYRLGIAFEAGLVWLFAITMSATACSLLLKRWLSSRR